MEACPWASPEAKICLRTIPVDAGRGPFSDGSSTLPASTIKRSMERKSFLSKGASSFLDLLGIAFPEKKAWALRLMLFGLRTNFGCTGGLNQKRGPVRGL